MSVEVQTTAASLVADGLRLLKSSDSPRLDAEILLAFTLGLERESIIVNPNMEVGDESVEIYRSLIERRATREPIAYIAGTKDFYKERFIVNRSVLIPRPETEGIVEELLKRFGDRKEMTLLDVGTGSGCIALSVALERKEWRVTGVDISVDALTVALENKKMLGADNVSFYESDLFASVKTSATSRYDVVVSNPPYIDRAGCDDLSEDVRGFEPHLALLADNEGLVVIERLLRDAPDYLNSGGFLLCEIGYDQKEKVRDILKKIPGDRWNDVEFINDLSGHTRIFVVELKG